MGVVFLEPLDNPFLTLDRCIDEAEKQGCKIILVDFHAEATAEKKSFGYYANGRVSAVFGTHTHTQTNDLQIFLMVQVILPTLVCAVLNIRFWA